MAWANPLDRLPQVRVDYANHALYGGALGAVGALALHVAGRADALVLALGGVLAVAAAKKVVDYVKEGESVAVCVAKTLVTAATPAALVGLRAAGL